MSNHPEAALWRAKIAGYTAVAEIVETERRRETPAERWRQLARLFAFARANNLAGRDAEGIAEARARWLRIKNDPRC